VSVTDNFPQTLPASWYCGAAQFAREEKAIFARNWSVLARTDQLSKPGDYVAGQIARWPVFVIRAEDGTLRGFHNVCSHRAGPLFDPGAERCNLSYGVRCRYHGWTFDANGALLKAPGFETNGGFRPEDHGLFPVRVEQWNGLLFGCLDAEAPALLSWLGDIPAIADEFPKASEMRYYREVVAEGEANWKAYGDNSVEGYHVPFVHSQLNQATLKIELEPHENGKFVGFRIAYGPWGNHPQSRGYWIYKFPCLLLHFSEYDFNLEQVYPLSPGKVRLVHWFWRPDDATPQGDYDEFTEGWRKTMAEDMAICTVVQQNLEAGVYEHGVLSPEKEPGTIFFQKLLGEALADAAG
jgi:choline monooxygenase